jgi:hypothetical protein
MALLCNLSPGYDYTDIVTVNLPWEWWGRGPELASLHECVQAYCRRNCSNRSESILVRKINGLALVTILTGTARRARQQGADPRGPSLRRCYTGTGPARRPPTAAPGSWSSARRSRIAGLCNPRRDKERGRKCKQDVQVIRGRSLSQPRLVGNRAAMLM